VAVATRAVPDMMARAMSGFMVGAMARMAEQGCDPGDF
jgi:hypothetical protein